MAQYELKYENKNEVKVLTEKLKILREEFKYSKDLLKSTESKIKSQNLYIFNTEQKCQKIKENIEFKKRNKETPGLKTANETRENLTNLETESVSNNISSYEEQMKFSEIQINAEEKNYKTEIARQQAHIAKMNEEISLLTIQLKEKEQDIRINDLKLKELKKINKHQQEQQRIQENENNELPENLRLQINYNSINYKNQRNTRNNDNNLNKRNYNNNNNLRPNSTNLRQIPVTMKQPKNSGSKPPATTMGRSTKPFTKNDIKFDIRNRANNNDINNNLYYENTAMDNNSNNYNNIQINSKHKNIKFNYNKNYISPNTEGNNNTNNNNINPSKGGNPRRVYNKEILNNNYNVNMKKDIMLMQRDDMLNEIESLSKNLR